eukprot:XP_025981853.1 ALA-interacting subunit 1-like [Glycine max]
MSVEPPSNSVAVADGRSKNAMKPKYSRFSQQELHAWQPILTPSWAISIFTVIELIFILVGLASCLHQGVWWKFHSDMMMNAFHLIIKMMQWHILKTSGQTKLAP